jgi:hypothetical protein
VNHRSCQVQSLQYIVSCFLFVAAAFANNPIPTVVGPPVPQAVVPGSGEFTLRVYGANFVSGAVVNWNRSPRTTTFISARELRAQILASDVAKPTAGYITVTNPPPGGGVSSGSYSLVEVHTPTATIAVGPPHAYLKDVGSFHLVLSDFNNDGNFDFAADYSFSEIKVFLGNGDGTLRPGPIATHNYYGATSAAIATGDFNNDGKEDLAFGADPNGPPTQLQVNLGNGDGTFRQGSRFGESQNNYPVAMAVGDFNGDGNLDLISLQYGSPTTSIFLGNGDGTFKHLLNYDLLGSYEVVLADFNGDGKLDLAVLSSNGLYVQLGNGDGTFQKPKRLVSSFNLGCSGQSLVVSDFDGDGKADLAYCERDQTNGKLWIALGNGDGTFKKPVFLPIASPQGAFTFAVGDFSSDGETDLITNYNISNTQTETDLYLGKGDGTFQHKKAVRLPGAPNYNAENGLVPADLNSDGLLDFIFVEPGVVSVFVQK